MNGEIVDDLFVRHARVGKFHMGEYHIALYFFYICHLCGFIFQLFLGKELKNSLGSGCRRLDVCHTLGDLTQRLFKQTHIDQKCRDHAKGDLTFHEQGTDDADCHIAEVSDKRHQRLHQSG